MEEQKKQEQGSHSLTAEFVPYGLALKLKALGFDEPCFGEYRQWDGCQPWLKLYQDSEVVEGSFTIECPSPTFSQAFRWFREKHQLSASISFILKDYFYEIRRDGEQFIDRPDSYKSYEEAELACLITLIEIVENKS